MRTKLLCLLAALILLPGCRSVKEFFFPSPTRSPQPGVYETTQRRQRQEGYEDRQNDIMREDRKGEYPPFPDGLPPY